MLIKRPWAFWRQLQYGFLFCAFWTLVFWLIYFNYFYQTPNCFDSLQNGAETGIDCGGECVRMCAFEVTSPKVLWAQSFKVAGDQYNAVAYIENSNPVAATEKLNYTFTLYEDGDVIVERTGSTILPPDSEYPVFEARINTNGRVPDKTELKLHPVDIWQPATNGRGQFQVNDRRLFDTDVRPRLEATIENRELTEAKEVEVIATIFDARRNPLTSSRTFIDNFAARSQENIVFTWPEPIAKTIRSCEVPTDVVMAIDLSGSMNNDGGNPPEPITSVLRAAQTFAGALQGGDQVGLVTFATAAVTKSMLTTDLSKVATAIGNLRIDPAEETGSTNTGDAIKTAHRELISDRHNEEARKVLVILTDGLATAPDEEPEEYALQAAKAVKNDDVIVYAIGLGSDVNMDFVRAVASTPTQAYQALSVGAVNQIYQTITAEICEDGPAVIDIVPKTSASFEPLR